MELQGKGLWAWRLWELDQALNIAPAMGITHILYKIGQGPLGDRPGFVINNPAAIAQRIRQAGYIPFAWSFTTLGDVNFEAQMALDAFTWGFEGFIFNAEDATKGRRQAAMDVGNALRAGGVELQRLYLCSYPTPLTHHPTIPFNEMGRYCSGGLMPMAYGTYLQPPEIVIDRWTYGQNLTWMLQQGLQLPIYPVLGPYYDNFAQQPMPKDVLQTWLDVLAKYAPTFFSVYTAAALIPEHHAPIRAFVLGSGSAIQTAWIANLGGAAVAANAGQADSQFIALSYGTAVQRLGPPRLINGIPWQRIRTEAIEGWVPAEQLRSTAPGAWPALPAEPIPPTGHLLTAWSTAEINTRSQPVIRPETLSGRIPPGTRLRIVQDTDKAMEWVGRAGFWIRAQIEPQGPTVWVAAWYLSPFDPLTPAIPGLAVEVHNPQDGFVNVRRGPSTAHERLEQVPHGTLLHSLESDAATQRKLGKVGDWLRVRTPTGVEGYVTARYLRLPPVELRPAGLSVRVHFPEQDQVLALYHGPSSAHGRLTRVPHNTLLTSLESESETRRKIGQIGEWLHVSTPEGLIGYAPAWHLRLPAELPTAVRYLRVEAPTAGLHLRAAPDPTAAAAWWLPHATVLESLESPTVTATKLGQANAWLQVRSPSRREGFVPVAALTALTDSDERRPVNDATLPLGRSAWLYGMHAADIADDTPQHRAAIRQLFESKNRRGWILFTQSIGSQPNAIPFNPELRERFWDWATAGYGVIVRLNHGYHPSGTLPESQHYDAFAATCARWVEYYLYREGERPTRYTWILQIGNEQNNPSEHPGDAGVIRENITPQLYAQAFNKVYTAIKAVLPRALIAPGAIDPYNSTPMQLVNKRYRPLEYFQEMLEGIQNLDAFILHAYTHGPSIVAITSLETFSDFMTDHYFDFQTYRQFMERIPAQWKQVPVIIGESNHICRPPSAPACNDPGLQGWINANIGWVRAVYEEIQNWNNMPHIQQIHGLLLYRWLGDQWELYNKDQILADFSQALEQDYRWRG